jgi:hypothetical protein
MAKKLSLLLAAVAVLAFAVPAFASAATPTLVFSEGGALVPTGTQIKGTGTNVVLTSNLLGEIKCEKLNLLGTLEVNSLTAGIEGKNTNAEGEKPETSNCKNGTKSVVVTNVTLTSLKSTVGGAATASFTAKVDVGTELVCNYTGTNVPGTYLNGGSTITFSGASGITATPPACGTNKLDGAFVLETSAGKSVKAVF